MKFSDWLDAEKGRAKAVADHFEVTPSAVTQWRSGVPRERMRDLHAFTAGQVAYEDMLPAAEAKAA
jgi:DNA-binding transcriptional regulator YdaS (Cro superfamily)